MNAGKQWGSFGVCPVCHKERKVTRDGKMRPHNRWDGTKMVHCSGSGRSQWTVRGPGR